MKRGSAPLLALLAACGEQSLAPVGVAPDCPAPAADLAPPTGGLLVDDFEDGDERLAVTPSPGRWGASHDDTSADMTIQNAGTCAAFGKRALHFRGAGFTGWGAVTAASLQRTSTGAQGELDARAYDSVAFYAAVAAGAADQPVRASVSTADTVPGFGICSDCYDSYGAKVTLTRTWQKFVVPIDAMMQWGWGVPRVAPPRREHLVELLFYAEGTFDVWIDDVRLVSSK